MSGRRGAGTFVEGSPHGAVETRLRKWFGQPGNPVSDERFEEVALRIFDLQFQGNESYRRFCAGRGRTPETVERWEDVPAVPAAAFKHLDLFSAPGGAEVIFTTSGTTRGGDRRGRHPVASLSLYRAASLPWFAWNLVPEGDRLPVLCLVPDPADAPDSSLSTMMGFAAEFLGTEESGFFAHPETGVDGRAFRQALNRAVASRSPVLVMGTAFAWVHWLEACQREGWRFLLPEGSRLMETGGFKGRSREVSRAQLYRSLHDRLGIPGHRVVNEYGMTELLSQLYEPSLRHGPTGIGAGGHRRAPPAASDADVRPAHRPPPWLRVRVLDPETLAPLAPGERGLLAFFDPANLGSVSAVLTEDVGWLEDGGVRVAGRARGAEPRGCSLAMEELLETAS